MHVTVKLAMLLDETMENSMRDQFEQDLKELLRKYKIETFNFTVTKVVS